MTAFPITSVAKVRTISRAKPIRLDTDVIARENGLKSKVRNYFTSKGVNSAGTDTDRQTVPAVQSSVNMPPQASPHTSASPFSPEVSGYDSGGWDASINVRADHPTNSGYALISTRACQAIGGMAAAVLLAGAAASCLRADLTRRAV